MAIFGFTSNYSFDSIKEDERSPAATPSEIMKYLAMTAEAGIPPHELKLKENCVCLFMRNISVNAGLVKIAQFIVRRLLDHPVEMETLPKSSNTYQATQFLLPRITLEFRP